MRAGACQLPRIPLCRNSEGAFGLIPDTGSDDVTETVGHRSAFAFEMAKMILENGFIHNRICGPLNILPELSSSNRFGRRLKKADEDGDRETSDVMGNQQIGTDELLQRAC
jgi:hypothetical protein